MADLVHNFSAQKCKRGASFKRATDTTLEVVGEADQHPTGNGSDGRAIVVMDSPEMGFHGQSDSETVLSADLREVPLTHAEVQEGIPSEQIAIRLDKASSSRSECSRSLLPYQPLLNSYIPPQGQAPPMEEVSAPGPEGAQEIINRWKSFNRGEYPTTYMEQLYPTLLQMLVAVLVKGKGEEYVSQSLLMLVRKISSRWLKTTC